MCSVFTTGHAEMHYQCRQFLCGFLKQQTTAQCTSSVATSYCVISLNTVLVSVCEESREKMFYPKQLPRVLCFMIVAATGASCLLSSCHNKDVNEVSWMCPPWLFFNGTDCECGDDVNGVVYCNPDMNSTFLLNCYCMTYDNIT